MFGRAGKPGRDPTGTVAAAGRTCRCEATTPPAVLEGFACGRADCWRTAEVRASFDRFVAGLVRRRAAAAPPDGSPP